MDNILSGNIKGDSEMTQTSAKKKTMTLNLSEKEMEHLEKWAAKTEMSKTAVMRQALKLYDLVSFRAHAGHEMIFRNTETGEILKPVIFGLPDLSD